MKETKTLHFRYESIGNFVRLLATIRFENVKTMRDTVVYHQRFKHEPDELYEQFLLEVYPEGGNIGEQEINELTEHIYRFMQKDETARDLYVEYDKSHTKSYVYFKPDKAVHIAEFGAHSALVTRICRDYFKDFDKIDVDYLKKFIIENFEIKSDNTTVESVSNDAAYIAREILKGDDIKQFDNETCWPSKEKLKTANEDTQT